MMKPPEHEPGDKVNPMFRQEHRKRRPPVGKGRPNPDRKARSRSSRYASSPSTDQFPVAAGQTVDDLPEGVNPCTMTKGHRNEVRLASETPGTALRSMIDDRFSKSAAEKNPDGFD